MTTCHFDRETTMTHEDPRQILEIEAEAGDEEIRAAYLRKVKQYPPERGKRRSRPVFGDDDVPYCPGNNHDARRSATNSGNRGGGRRRRDPGRLSAQSET